MKLKAILLSIFSFLSLALINSAPNAKANVFAFLGAGLLLLAGIKKNIFKDFRLRKTLPSSIMFCAAISSIMGIRFFGSWSNHVPLSNLFSGNENLKTFSLTAATLFLISGTFFASCAFINYALNAKNSPQISEENSASKRCSPAEYVLIFITAALCITVCSKSSPIYPFNDWVDANCFFTVGKSIANGKTLYKDIFEQKGPLLYFLHSLCYTVSPTTFFGVYLFEIASCFSFLVICYKAMRLFCSKRIILAVPVLSAVIYSSPAFSHGGSAEEFCLPFIALSFFIGLKALNAKRNISLSEWAVIGVTASVVLWTKYTLLGFYIGFVLFFALTGIKKKELKYFSLFFISFLLGFVTVSLPVILYFVSKNALSDLLNVYFYSNMSMYTKNSSDSVLAGIGNNLYLGIKSFSVKFSLLFALLLLGGAYLFARKKNLFAFYACTVICAFCFIFIGGRRYPYYSLTLAVFAPIGAISIYKSASFLLKGVIQKLYFKRKTVKFSAVFAVFLICFTTAFYASPNTYLLKYSKDNMPQFVFDKIISQSESPTLLNYGFLDGGFYTVSNIVPNCKYFCKLNIPYDEMEKTQEHYVKNGMVDFVVTRNEKLPEGISSQYQIVSTTDFRYEKKDYTYYLYKLIH